MSKKLGLGLCAFTLCIGMLSACSSGSEDENTGLVQLAIAEVPAEVGCLEVEVVGNRTAEELFDVSPGQPANVQMGSLPAGNVAVTAKAYAGGCGNVTATSTPIWLSDAAPVTLIAGEPVSATLTLRKNGIGNFSVEFDDDDATTCPTGQTLCGSACVNLQTSSANCGACGNVCSGGNTCNAGSCACAADLVRCGSQCVDIEFDNQNCGACGRRCSGNTFCDVGACVRFQCAVPPCL